MRARAVASEFAALLLRESFAPLARSLGPFGDVALDGVTRSIAREERGGLTDQLERTIERAR